VDVALGSLPIEDLCMRSDILMGMRISVPNPSTKLHDVIVLKNVALNCGGCELINVMEVSGSRGKVSLFK
jgi:hypothetical protein